MSAAASRTGWRIWLRDWQRRHRSVFGARVRQSRSWRLDSCRLSRIVSRRSWRPWWWPRRVVSGLPGFIVGWPFRERAAEVRDTRLLTSYGCHVVVSGSDELHKGTLTPVVLVVPFLHNAREGQAAGRRALVVELIVRALAEVAAGAPPHQEARFRFRDALGVGYARADPASYAPRELYPVCGDVEHRHEHTVVLIEGFGLSPLTWDISVALATWLLDSSDAEVGPGQAFGEGDQECPRVFSIFCCEAARKRGHVHKRPS